MKVFLLIIFLTKLYESSHCLNEVGQESKLCGKFNRCESQEIFSIRNKRETNICTNDACYLLVGKFLEKYNVTFQLTKNKISHSETLWNTDKKFRKAVKNQRNKINHLSLTIKNATSKNPIGIVDVWSKRISDVENKVNMYLNISQNDLKTHIVDLNLNLKDLEDLKQNQSNLSSQIIEIFKNPSLNFLFSLLNETNISKNVTNIVEESRRNKLVSISTTEKASSLLKLLKVPSQADYLMEIKLKLMKYNSSLNELPNVNVSVFNNKFEMMDSYMKKITRFVNHPKGILTMINEFEIFYNATEEKENMIRLEVAAMEYIIHNINNLIDFYRRVLEAQENFIKLLEAYATSKQTLYEDLKSEIDMQEKEISNLTDILKKLYLDLHVTRGVVTSFNRCIEKIEKSILKANSVSKELIVTEIKIKNMEDELELLEKEKNELYEIYRKEQALKDEIQYLENEVMRLKIIGDQLDNINITCIPKITLN